MLTGAEGRASNQGVCHASHQGRLWSQHRKARRRQRAGQRAAVLDSDPDRSEELRRHMPRRRQVAQAIRGAAVSEKLPDQDAEEPEAEIFRLQGTAVLSRAQATETAARRMDLHLLDQGQGRIRLRRRRGRCAVVGCQSLVVAVAVRCRIIPTVEILRALPGPLAKLGCRHDRVTAV